jgi:hypothetical protein
VEGKWDSTKHKIIKMPVIGVFLLPVAIDTYLKENR